MFVDQAIKVLSYSYAAIRLIVLVKKIIGSFKYVNATWQRLQYYTSNIKIFIMLY